MSLPAYTGAFIETLDGDSFRLDGNGLRETLRALAAGDMDLFLDAQPLFDHQDFLQYWNNERAAFIALGQGH